MKISSICKATTEALGHADKDHRINHHHRSAAETIMHSAFKCPLVAQSSSSSWRKPIALTDDFKHILAAKPQSNREMGLRDPSKNNCHTVVPSSSNSICLLTASGCSSSFFNNHSSPQVVGLCCQVHNNHNHSCGSPHTPPSPPKQSAEPKMPKCGHSVTSPRKPGHRSPNSPSKDLADRSACKDTSAVERELPAAAVPVKFACIVSELHFVQPPPSSPPQKGSGNAKNLADSSACGNSSEDKRDFTAAVAPEKLTCLVSTLRYVQPPSPAASPPPKGSGNSKDLADSSEDERERPAATASGLLTCLVKRFVKPPSPQKPPPKICGNPLIALIIGGADSSSDEETEEEDSDWEEWEEDESAPGICSKPQSASPDICFGTEDDEDPTAEDSTDEDVVDGGCGDRSWTDEDAPAVVSTSAKRKKVTFASDDKLVLVHVFEGENPKGPWETAARDRERFERRIRMFETVIGPYLSTEHRGKVYRDRQRQSARD